MMEDDDTLLENGGIDRIRRIFPDDAQATVERDLWDSVAMEPARLGGTRFRFWSLRRAKNMHPLYREPSADNGDWEFNGPWEIYGAMEFEQANDVTPNARAEGLTTESEAILWIARREFEDVQSPRPKIGDVMEFWDEQPWGPLAHLSALGEEYRYWDITKANPHGEHFNSPVFSQYKISIVRRSEFEAGRKTLGDGP